MHLLFKQLLLNFSLKLSQEQSKITSHAINNFICIIIILLKRDLAREKLSSTGLASAVGKVQFELLTLDQMSDSLEMRLVIESI